MDQNAPLILLAAGGTGGHLFPAEALGVELIKRGLRVRLVTDARALHYSVLFTSDDIDVCRARPCAGPLAGGAVAHVTTLGHGTLVAVRLIGG